MLMASNINMTHPPAGGGTAGFGEVGFFINNSEVYYIVTRLTSSMPKSRVKKILKMLIL